MVQQVIDSSNIGQFIETGKVDAFKDQNEKVEEVKAADVKAEEVDEDGLTAQERKELGAKFDKVVGKRHKLMMEAKEQAKEAEAFAEQQYRERKAAEKRADEIEARMKELESKAAPKREVTEPKREDFENDADYWDKKIEWKAAEAVRKDREERALEEQAREAQRLDAQRIERNKAFAKTVPDYEETVASLPADLQVPGHIAQYLLESETAPALMYHMAKNPDEFTRIAQLTPIKAIAALGKLEATLEKAKDGPVKDEPKLETKVVERSKAPEPIAPIEASQGSVQKELRDMTTRETIEYWEARDQARAHRRQRH